MGFFASVNGVVTPAAEARVSVLDNGFTFGDSVYETLRTYGGRPFHLDRHLRRLRESAGRLSIALPIGDDEMARRVDAVLAQAGNAESYIRLIVSRGVGDISYRFERVAGPTVVVAVKSYEPLPERWYTDGIDVVVSPVRRNHRLALDPAIKSCNLINNILAMQDAQARGAQEPLLLNHDGDVAEGAGSNVFLVSKGGLLTPPLEAGILAGVTRALVLDIAHGLGLRAREDTVRVADLLSAEEVFITSTLKEICPVRAIDGKAVGPGRPGPVTQQLTKAYREYARSHRSPLGADR
jgi:branched-chain amino acid aminotransferase